MPIPEAMTQKHASIGHMICWWGFRLYLSSRNPPIIRKNPPRIRPNTFHNRTCASMMRFLVPEKNNNSAIITQNAAKMPIPPKSGIGCVCIFLASVGLSVMSQADAIIFINHVKMHESAKLDANNSAYVIFLKCACLDPYLQWNIPMTLSVFAIHPRSSILFWLAPVLGGLQAPRSLLAHREVRTWRGRAQALDQN